MAPLSSVLEGRSSPASTSYVQSLPFRATLQSRHHSVRWHQSICCLGSEQQVASLKLFGRASHSLTRAAAAADDTSGLSTTLIGVGEVVDVEDVEGIRVLPGEDNKLIIQYLVKWKDGAASTWEPVENLADNLLRDFEDKWWNCCRDGDEETMRKLLASSPNVLPFCVDKNERSALHFAAALGKLKCCQMLCEAGAAVDYPDKDGYTPLHMAVGYSRVATVRTLLEAGANPEIPDTQGRNVIQLVDSIREQMPLNPQLAEKRIALEEVSALLTGNLFEEVFPKRILEARAITSGKEYLVQWMDGAEDSWVKESNVADDVIADFEKGFEYAEAESLRKMKKRGDQRLYLVRWLDGRPDSWEFEDHVSSALIAAFEKARDGSAETQQSLLPEPLEFEKPISKRARRRAKRLARQAALASQGQEALQALDMAAAADESATENSNGAHGGGQNVDVAASDNGGWKEPSSTQREAAPV